MDRYKRYTPRTCPCGDRIPESVISDETQYCVCTDQPVSLAMAYVPMQEFRGLFGTCEALEHGTLFEELYKPYCMGGCRR